MSEQVQYIAILKDENFLGALQKIAGQGNATWSKLNSLQDQYQAEVNASAAATDKMNTKMRGLNQTGGMLSGTFNALFAGFSIFTLFQAGKSALQEYDEQEKSNAQTNAVLASTNSAAGKSMEDIVNAADKLSKSSLFPDDAIQGAENLMLTFTNVRGEMFDKSIPAIMDMSQALGQDLKSSTIQVGKALQDPIRGVTALRRVGVAFSDDQQEMINKLVETGRIGEAQAIILKELEKEFGGSAKAAYEAANPLVRLRNRFNDIRESVGQFINNGLEKLNPLFTGFAEILEKTIAWVKENKDLVGLFATALGAFAAGILVVVSAIKIWTAIQWLLNASIWANPIGLIIAGIIAFVAAIIYAWNKFEAFRGFLIGLWESFKAIFTNIRELAMNVLGGIGELLIGIFTFDKEKLMSGFAKLKSGFVEYGQKVGESFSEGYAKGVDMKADEKEGGALAKAFGGGGDPGGDPGGDGTGEAIGSFSGTENRKTINITIGSLIQKLEFNTSNVQSGIEDIKEEVQRVLLSAVNNVNMIAG